ncbi:neuronal acetylcholine receptor subunit alpha-2-like [Gigantopelta aegis]|uniref:neuronal acetylcholine receptor subunit alpha-2-like n=1 Tax=Gigantopelta aegis TaxID=1735272 RepID=UPI001B88C8EB|nr:neuronal acetylcholine receptor subunit alpha-2-like [Gigantopelta aegis]
MEDISEADQTMLTRGWLELSWQDELLSWNASDYSGIDSLTLPINKLWIPDITLLNDVQGYQLLSDKGGMLRLSNTGQVHWYIGLVVGTTCTINVVRFPFDSQQCFLNFSQWSTHSNEVDIKPIVDPYMFEEDNGEWRFLNQSYIREEFQDADTVHTIVFIGFSFQRMPLSFIISGIIPMVLISIVNLGSFMLPLGSEEKVSMGVSVLLSFYIFISGINSLLPDVSNKVSIFKLYVVIMLTLKVMTTLSSVIILHFYYKPTSKPLPRWLQELLLAICKSQQTNHTDVQQDADVKNRYLSGIREHGPDPDWKMVAETLNTVCFITFAVLTLCVSVICFYVMVM